MSTITAPCFSLEAETLKLVTKALSVVTEEARFTVTPEGLSFRLMDPSHVMLLEAEIPNAACDRFDVTGEIQFTVRVPELLKTLQTIKTTKKIQPVVKVIVDPENFTLTLDVDGNQKTIHTLENSKEETPLPKIPFNVKAVVENKTLLNILKDMAAVYSKLNDRDPVTLDATGESFTVSTRDTGSENKAKVTLPKSHQSLLQLKSLEDTHTVYSLYHLLNIVKTVTAPDIVTVEYNTRMPIRLTWALSDKGGVMKYWIAPRIEEREAPKQPAPETNAQPVKTNTAPEIKPATETPKTEETTTAGPNETKADIEAESEDLADKIAASQIEVKEAGAEAETPAKIEEPTPAPEKRRVNPPKTKGKIYEDLKAEVEKLSVEASELVTRRLEEIAAQAIKDHYGDITPTQKENLARGVKELSEIIKDVYDTEDTTADLNSVVRQVIAGKRPAI